MTVNKKFLEAVSKDEALKSELEQATLEALGEFLKSKGLEEEAGKIAEAAMEKVAEAHGFKADEMTELSEDELEAVAGGVCACPVAGGKRALVLRSVLAQMTAAKSVLAVWGVMAMMINPARQF